MSRELNFESEMVKQTTEGDDIIELTKNFEKLANDIGLSIEQATELLEINYWDRSRYEKEKEYA